MISRLATLNLKPATPNPQPALIQAKNVKAARNTAVGLIRGRLRRQYPDLSLRELNLKVLEEIDRGGRT